MLVGCLVPGAAFAQTALLSGTLRDETGGALPGVSVELESGGAARRIAVTDARGVYGFDAVPPGPARVTFILINFATARRDATMPASGVVRVDAVLHLALNADVVVTGKSTFTNLADVERPAENLVGIAQAASQGAITAQQLEARPMMRAGEVLETVPGVIISQHSGEGKANQRHSHASDDPADPPGQLHRRAIETVRAVFVSTRQLTGDQEAIVLFSKRESPGLLTSCSKCRRRLTRCEAVSHIPQRCSFR